MDNTIYRQDEYRILEVIDECSTLEDLKGDCYNADLNSDICSIQLKNEEVEFESKCYNEGVYGYILEKWNSDIGQGWEHVDSCFGFVGTHAEENHYIVDELKAAIK